MNKYEVRMKAKFWYNTKIVKSMTLIDALEVDGMAEAIRAAYKLRAKLMSELYNEEKGHLYGFEELVEFRDVNEVNVEITAIVPYSG